ncbi:MAG: T9SS type A sorting domain-containing protein [Bacteroidales bacterium]|nr:T9SS type A sorting domain-containing protein [Bacteroidales bacterium]
MKKFLGFALALVMTIGAFAQSQIAAHRLDVAKETKKEFKLNSRNLDPSNLKKLVPNETKAMSIDIDIVTIEALSVEVTFTPNDEVAAYYYLVADPSIVAEYLALFEMFGMTATEAEVVMMLAENADAPATGVQTLTLNGDYMTPGAENVVYAVGVAADESVALFQETFTAESLGGSGDAMVTIDIPADSVTAFSFYASITPNDQTAYYKYIVLDQSMLTEAQWNNDSIMAYLSTQSSVYTPISGTIDGLEPNMTLAFYAIAYNADGVASDLVSQSVTTSSLGGEGTAAVAVTVSDVTAFSAYISFVPNDQTAYYYYMIASDEELAAENITSDADMQTYLEAEDYKVYTTLEGSLDGLAMGTTYKVYALAYNANDEIASIAPATTFTTLTAGGTGLAEVAVDIEVVDGVATYETTMNDQTAYFYFAVYYGIEDYTDEQVLQLLESNPDMIRFEDQSNYIDFATAEADLFGIFIVPLNANEEVGTTVAIRFTAEGVLGLQDVNIPTLNVYPNPAKTQVTVTSSSSIDRIEVTNILGQKVYENATVGANQTTINVADLQNGAYFVRVYSENCVITRKLIVK